MNDETDKYRSFGFASRLKVSVVLFVVSYFAFAEITTSPGPQGPRFKLAGAITLLGVSLISFCAGIGILFRHWVIGIIIAIAIGAALTTLWIVNFMSHP